MKSITKHTILFALSLCLSCEVFAQQNVSRSTASHRVPVESWTVEAWTGDNNSYKRIREQINASIASKQDLNAVVQNSQALAEKNPNDPKLEYKYAYAMYRRAIETKPFDANNLVAVRDALQRGYPPHAYDYTRLRFLVESTLFKNETLIPVGERLISFSPEDASLKYNLIQVLTCSTSASDLKTAVAYAQDLVRTKPMNADYHGTLAGAYLDAWFETKNKLYLRAAIGQYQVYLALAPADAEYRKTVVRLLKTLQPMAATAAPLAASTRTRLSRK